MKKVYFILFFVIVLLTAFVMFYKFKPQNTYKVEVEELIKKQKTDVINKTNKIYDKSKEIYIKFLEEKNISSKEKLCEEFFYSYIFDLESNGRILDNSSYDFFIEIRDIIDKYERIKDKTPTEYFSGALYNFLYPYLNKNHINTEELFEIPNNSALKSQENKQYIQEIYSYCSCKPSYKKSETISLDEYLYVDKTKEDWKTLTLNDKKDVIFKNKVILNDFGIPINKKTAYTSLELKIYFAAAGIEPREGCDPADTLTNGTLGCYIDNPDE